MNSDIKNFFKSKLFTKILYGIGIVIIALLIFRAGIFVGYHKAAFSYQRGDNYYHTFGSNRNGFFMGIPGDDFANAHGATGKIIKINLPTFIVEDDDHTEKIVVINNNTAIRHFRETATSNDLKIGDFVVVIGSPNNKSEIEANLIRLIPPPQDFNTATSTQPK